jgi:hypothetical protein
LRMCTLSLLHQHHCSMLSCHAQAADDANKASATRDVKDRGAFLRVLEAALVAAHRPFTLLLPAATTILALRETSRWLELLLDLHDDHLPRFAAYTAKIAIHVRSVI